MSKETRIALLAIVSVAILIIGYKFIIGKSILSKRQFFYVKYKDIDQLQVSNPVMINGYQVGSVNKIYLDPADNTTPIVVLEVNSNIKVPKEAKAVLTSLGLMGGKAVQLQFTEKCTTNCAKSGDYLIADAKSLISNFIGEGELEGYMGTLKNTASQLFDSITGESGKKEIKQSVANLEMTLQNLAHATTTLNSLLSRNTSKLDKMITNMESVIGNIQNSNHEISNILKNADSIGTRVRDANLSKTIGEFNETLQEGKKSIQGLQHTLKSADESLISVNALIKKAQEGDGTAAKILNDPALYQNLSNTSRQLELFLQDLRLNPKRYVNVSVFGKKQKEYTPAENDPAMVSDTLK